MPKYYTPKFFVVNVIGLFEEISPWYST